MGESSWTVPTSFSSVLLLGPTLAIRVVFNHFVRQLSALVFIHIKLALFGVSKKAWTTHEGTTLCP